MTKDQAKQRSSGSTAGGTKTTQLSNAFKASGKSADDTTPQHRCTLQSLCPEEKKKVAGLLKQVVDLGQEVSRLQEEQVDAQEYAKAVESNQKLAEENASLKAKLSHMVMILRAYQAKVKELLLQPPPTAAPITAATSAPHTAPTEPLPHNAPLTQPAQDITESSTKTTAPSVSMDLPLASDTLPVPAPSAPTANPVLSPPGPTSVESAPGVVIAVPGQPTPSATVTTLPGSHISITIQHCPAGCKHQPCTAACSQPASEPPDTASGPVPAVSSRPAPEATAPASTTPVAAASCSTPEATGAVPASWGGASVSLTGPQLPEDSCSPPGGSPAHAAVQPEPSTSGSHQVTVQGACVTGSPSRPASSSSKRAMSSSGQSGTGSVVVGQQQVAAVAVQPAVEVLGAGSTPNKACEPLTMAPSPLLVAPEGDMGPAAAALLEWQHHQGLLPSGLGEGTNRVLKFDPSIGRLGAFLVEDLAPAPQGAHRTTGEGAAEPPGAASPTPEATVEQQEQRPPLTHSAIAPPVAAELSAAPAHTNSQPQPGHHHHPQPQQHAEADTASELEPGLDDGTFSDLVSELTLSSFPGTPATPLTLRSAAAHPAPRPTAAPHPPIQPAAQPQRPAQYWQQPQHAQAEAEVGGASGSGWHGPKVQPLTLDSVLRDQAGADTALLAQPTLLRTATGPVASWPRLALSASHGTMAKLAAHLAAPTKPVPAAGRPSSAPRPAETRTQPRHTHPTGVLPGRVGSQAKLSGGHTATTLQDLRLPRRVNAGTQQRTSVPSLVARRLPPEGDSAAYGSGRVQPGSAAMESAEGAWLMAGRVAHGEGMASHLGLFDDDLMDIVMEAEASIAGSVHGGDSPLRAAQPSSSPTLRHRRQAAVIPRPDGAAMHNAERVSQQQHGQSRLDAHTMALRAALAAVQQSQQLDEDIRQVWGREVASSAGARQSMGQQLLGPSSAMEAWGEQEGREGRGLGQVDEHEFLLSLLHEDL